MIKASNKDERTLSPSLSFENLRKIMRQEKLAKTANPMKENVKIRTSQYSEIKRLRFTNDTSLPIENATNVRTTKNKRSLVRSSRLNARYHTANKPKIPMIPILRGKKYQGTNPESETYE
jgi:hexokinase